MKFVFVDCFDIKWNGYTARYERGVSGSHNSQMYIAEAISKDIQNSVDFVSTENNIIECHYLDVNYINIDNFERTECDYIIIPMELRSLIILNKIQSYKKIIILTHNEFSYCNLLSQIEPNKILISYISEFAKTNILNTQPFLNNYKSIILHNSIDYNDFINYVDNSNKENQLCYFACIQRGYKMVVEILKKLDNYKLVTNTYADIHRNLFITRENNVFVLDNSSKYNILNNISRSRYFIYPLIDLDNNCIHYDTFCYVVLEALLLGTVVIAPKIKVYEELYGGAICYIETDDLIPQEDLLYWKKYNHNFGYPLLNRYVEKVKLLDENDELRNSYIKKGLSLRHNFKFSNVKVASQLIAYLKNEGDDRNEENNLYPSSYSEKNIVTVFAGREKNMEILCKYLRKALDLKIIDEVHLWNNTRCLSDEKYIKSISNLKRVSNATSLSYTLINPVIINNSFTLHVKGMGNIQIIMDEYEIILGERNTILFNNNKIFFSEKDREKEKENKNKKEHKENRTETIKFAIIHNNLLIYKNGSLFIETIISYNFQIKNVYFKTTNDSVTILDYEPINNKGFYFMDTCEKSWKNYYQYYTDEQYKCSTIIKCDDDIVFIDLKKLPNFIDFVKNNDYDLVFANTINNGVSAYYQQNYFDLIPSTLMKLEFPNDNIYGLGGGGSLWKSGEKGQKLHNYFIDNYSTFVDYNFHNIVIPINTRFSINFFGFKGSNWNKISDCYFDDERILTVDYVKNRNFKNILYCDLFVSHLSFYKQIETNIDLNYLINRYNQLFQIVNNRS